MRNNLDGYILQVSVVGWPAPPTYLMSPAYPKYYQPGLACSWEVRANQNPASGHVTQYSPLIGQVRVPPHQRVAVRLLDLQLRQEPRQPCQQPQVSCDWSAAAGLSSDWLQCGAACRDQLRVGGAAAVCGELRAEVTVASPGNTLLVQLTTGQSLEAVLFYSNKTQFISTLLHLVSLLKFPPLSPQTLSRATRWPAAGSCCSCCRWAARPGAPPSPAPGPAS